jgi:D-alanyl-D-alanine carboxypeptidase
MSTIERDVRDLLERYAARAPESPALMLRVDAPRHGLELEDAVGAYYHGGPPVPARGAAYGCASQGKTFVAAACMRFAERGELDLDAPLSTWLAVDELDRLSTVDGAAHGTELTPRQLLNHTSGLPDLYAAPYRYAQALGSPDARTRRFSHADQVAAMRDVPALAPPGELWFYSDLNYTLLGLLLEAVGRVPMHETIRREVLEPLGLERTWSRGFEAPPLPVVATYGMFDDGPDSSTRVYDTGCELNGTWELAGGGIDLTLGDSTRFMSALLGGELVAPSVVDEMRTAAELSLAPTPDRIGGATGYGLGLFRYAMDGLTFWGHDGVYGSRLATCDELGVTFSFTFNAWSSGTGERDEDLRRELGDELTGLLRARLGGA